MGSTQYSCIDHGQNFDVMIHGDFIMIMREKTSKNGRHRCNSLFSGFFAVNGHSKACIYLTKAQTTGNIWKNVCVYVMCHSHFSF